MHVCLQSCRTSEFGTHFTVRLCEAYTHGIAVEILSVRLSVRLSVKRMYCDETKAPSEKSSIMTNRKSPTSFPMSLTWTSYIAPNPQRGPQMRQFCSFRIKNGLRWKKVCCKVCLCENCQRQSCKVFTSLSICAEMVGWPWMTLNGVMTVILRFFRRIR